MNAKYRMHDFGAMTEILGIMITRDRKEKTITLDQSSYTLKLLSEEGFINAREVDYHTCKRKSSRRHPRLRDREWTRPVLDAFWGACYT